MRGAGVSIDAALPVRSGRRGGGGGCALRTVLRPRTGRSPTGSRYSSSVGTHRPLAAHGR